MKIGLLMTTPLQDHDNGEIGQFEQEVSIDEKRFLASGDKAGIIKSTIAAYLASCIQSTKVPAEYWIIEINPPLALALNFPRIMKFKES